MPRRMSRHLVAAQSAVLALTTVALAGDNCDIYRLNIPDFDQRRDGLPAGGSTHCVPTSAANWLAYISNHGFPAVFDGPRNWQSQANYDFVTDRLDILGSPALMDVVPSEGGTSLGDFVFGMQAWLDTFAPGKFVVQCAGSSANYTPSPQGLYGMMAFGALVNICHGRYTLVPGTTEIPPYLARTGGHCVTLARTVDACSNSPELWYRDPAGFDGDTMSQAQFVTQKSTYATLTHGYSWAVGSPPSAQTRWRRLTGDPNTYSILDGIGWVSPLVALTANPQFGEVSFMPSFDFDIMGPPPAQTWHLPGGAVLGLKQVPGTAQALALVGERAEPATLWMIDLDDGSRNSLGEFANVGPMVFGNRGILFLMGDGSVRAISYATTPPATVGMALVGDMNAFAFNDATETLWMLSADLNTLTEAQFVGGANPFSLTSHPRPSGLILAGEPSMFVSPTDGSLWVCSDLENAIYQVVEGAGGLHVQQRLILDGIVNPKNLHVTSRGTLVFTSNGVVRELQKADFALGGPPWFPVSHVPFVGQTVPPVFELMSSRYVLGDWSDTESDVNIDPPGDAAPIACPQDVNHDHFVNFGDILFILANYGATTGDGDADLDNDADFGDILAVLAAFGAICP